MTNEEKNSSPSKGVNAIIDIIAIFLFAIGVFIVFPTLTKSNINVRDLAIGVELQLIALGIIILNKR
jgi:hypothetical protein